MITGAQIDGISDAQITSNALLNDALRVTEALRALGITEADKVAMCSENRLEIAAAMFGTMLLGATLVPMNPTYTTRELHHAVHLARPKVVFVSADTVAAVQAVAGQSAFIQTVVALDAVPSGAGKTVAYREFAGVGRPVRADRAPFRCRPQNMAEKVALILYSSGTMGLPKGVELTEKNILVSIWQFEYYSISFQITTIYQ